MSDKWIDERLDNSVGKEKADEIRMADLEGNVSKVVFHMTPNGDKMSCEVRNVDADGYYDGKGKQVAEYSADEVKFEGVDNHEG